MRYCHVHLLPDLVAPEALAGTTTVVIDVLRATTTIVHALAAGARRIVLCAEVDEARERKAAWSDGSAVLGGERQGIKQPGFDLGNSPSEYTAERVGGKTVIFTTTNGTRAMLRCRQAQRVICGALVNRRAVLRSIGGQQHVNLVCAGTRGEISLEDTLLAGALVAGLSDDDSWQLNDQAALARHYWLRTTSDGEPGSADQRDAFFSLWTELEDSAGGRNLVAEGFRRDIMTCAWLDEFDIVPVLDTVDLTIRV